MAMKSPKRNTNPVRSPLEHPLIDNPPSLMLCVHPYYNSLHATLTIGVILVVSGKMAQTKACFVPVVF